MAWEKQNIWRQSQVMWILPSQLKVEFREKEKRNDQNKVSDVNMFPTNYVPNDEAWFHEYICAIDVKIHTHTHTQTF